MKIMDRALGIIAPSSQVPRVELKLGVHTLREAGFQVKIHPQCFQSHLFFAGTDEERGEAFFEFAHDKELRALWCARGGYGAIRLLPLLDAMTRKKGVPLQEASHWIFRCNSLDGICSTAVGLVDSPCSDA